MESLASFVILISLIATIWCLPEEKNAEYSTDMVTLNCPHRILVELRRNELFIRHCGGAQFHTEWFITAAECASNTKVGELNKIIVIDSKCTTDKTFLSEDPISHPLYNKKTKENNIAIMKCIDCGSAFQGVLLPFLPLKIEILLNYQNEQVILSARLNRPNTERRTVTDVLANVTRPLWCKLAYPLSFKEDQHLCVLGALNIELSLDDVGAPLVIPSCNVVNTLIGIATNIRPFTSIIRMPMVFTRLTPYVDWIQSITKIETQ